jgi:hypothetical protein
VMRPSMRKLPAPARSKPPWAALLLVLGVVIGGVVAVVAFFGSRKTASPPVPAQAATLTPSDAAPIVVDEPAPRIAEAPVDASIAATATVETSKAVAVTPKTVARGSRDAGVGSAAPPPQIAASQTNAVNGPAPGQLPVNGNGQGGAPSWGPYSAAWQNTKHGKLDVVRAAVKDVGYDGFSASWKKDDLEKTIESATGTEQAIAQVKLGMVLRKSGDCKSASPKFRDAVLALKPFDDPAEGQWRGRAAVARALCTLAAGDPRLARAHLMDAINTFPGEIQLVHAISQFEGDSDRALAYAHFITAAKQGDATVKAAVKTYLDGYGLSLGP